MKAKINLNFIVIICLTITISYGCKKEELPVLTTNEVFNIYATTAMSGGIIIDEGSATVIARGICWSTSTTPTIENNKTIEENNNITDGTGAILFTSIMSGLNAATVYYVRAYATNNIGTGYGMALSFTTLGQAPISTNSAATNISTNSATLNGTVNPNYLSTVVTFEYGTTTSYGSIATPPQSPVTTPTSTNVSASISGLETGTTYHYRIKAVNSLGTTYSTDMSFTTLGQKFQLQ